DLGEQHAHADRELEPVPAHVQRDEGRAARERQQDRQQDQVVDPIHHAPGSSPSTWSVSVSPRAPIITTRYSAVVANPMTIAVSTSACGSGSACKAGSTGPSPTIGGRSSQSLPIRKMKRFTA